jgi:hypothetical protein
MKMTREQKLSAFRTLAKIAGAALVTRGVTDEAGVAATVNMAETVIGGLLGLWGAVASWKKHKPGDQSAGK